MRSETKHRSSSRIPLPRFVKTNPTMQHYKNPPPTSVAGLPDKHQSRRDMQRSSAVNYQPASRRPSDLESYLPPQQQSKHSGHCSPRTTKHIFEKDFGPFGTVPRQHVGRKSDTGDIASMFKRPDYQPVPCLLQQQQQPSCSPRPAANISGPSNGTCGVIMGGTGWQTETIPNRNSNILCRSQLPSTDQPTVICGVEATISKSSQRSLRRNEDVDRILNKYGRTSKCPRDPENNKDPDFSTIGTDVYVTTPDKYCKQSKLPNQVFQGYWDNEPAQDPNSPQRRRNVPVPSPAGSPRDQICNEGGGHSVRRFIEEATATNCPQQRHQLAPAPIHCTGENHQPNHFPQIIPPAAPTLKQSTHIFPFKETADGHLLVEPCQITFESRKLCVLMSDPSTNTTIEFSTNKCNSGALLANVPSKHERILHEVKKAMSLVETSDNNYGNFNQSLYGMRQGIHSCYSDSKKGSEDFEQRIFLRLNCGKNADTNVMIGDKVFPCHSMALEAFSSYFDRLSRPPENVQKVYLPENEVSGDAFTIVMDWILQSEEERLTIPKKDNLVSLYIAAKYLGIKELESQCLKFMERQVDSNDPDLMTIWDAVKKRQSLCPELVRIVASKLAASYHDIMKSKRYLQMDVDELYMLLSSDDVSIDSEMDVYNSAITWLLHDFKNRKPHTNKIMSAVRFGLLTPLQLTQISRCPEIGHMKSEKDFNQIMTFGTVKSMIDDGLSYSILDESYKSQPEELRKWVEKTGMKVPTQRTALLRKKLRGGPLVLEKISLLEDASQSKLKSEVGKGGPPAHTSSSYTIPNNEPRPDMPRIGSDPGNDMNSSPSNKNSPDRSKSRIPMKSNNKGLPPAPSRAGTGTFQMGPDSTAQVPPRPGTFPQKPESGSTPPAAVRPGTGAFQYPPEPANSTSPVVHELSKPKRLVDSGNASDTEIGGVEESRKPTKSALKDSSPRHDNDIT